MISPQWSPSQCDFRVWSSDESCSPTLLQGHSQQWLKQLETKRQKQVSLLSRFDHSQPACLPTWKERTRDHHSTRFKFWYGLIKILIIWLQKKINRLASLKVTLIRNYDTPTDRLSVTVSAGYVVYLLDTGTTSVSKTFSVKPKSRKKDPLTESSDSVMCTGGTVG